MKRLLAIVFAALFCVSAHAQKTKDTTKLEEVSVVSFYTNTTKQGSLLEARELQTQNLGQEPSHMFKKLPSVFAFSDNGTEFGYGYFRIRGLDQTRINVTLDGCPWNEAEDFGVYFANSPDLMSSMHSVKVERGASSSYNGIAGTAGGINLESANLYADTTSSIGLTYGSFNTFKLGGVYNMGNKNGWGMHIKASHSMTDGYRENSWNSSQAVTVKTGYKFNNRHSVDFMTINGYHRNNQGWIGCTDSVLMETPRANGNNGKEDDEWFMSMNRIQYRGWLASRLLFVASAYAQVQTGSYRMDWNNYKLRMLGMEEAAHASEDTIYSYGLAHVMAGGNTMAKWIGKKLTITFGANAYHYERRHFYDKKSVNVDYYDNTGRKTDASAFGVVSANPAKGLTVSANIQYRYVDFKYKDNAVEADLLKIGVWNFCNAGVAVDYVPKRFVKAYARFNYVNREPTRSDMLGGCESLVDANYAEDIAQNSERAADVEFGFEFKFSKLEFNINGYYMGFKNELMLNGLCGENGLPMHTPATNSYRSGVEVALNWNIAAKLYLVENFAYCHGRFDLNNYHAANGETTNLKNNTQPFTPSVTNDVDLVWKDKRWKIGINANARSAMFVDAENVYKLPAAYTINAFATVTVKNAEFGVVFKNITNNTKNYNNAVVGANLLLVQEAGFNAMGTIRINL